MKIQLKKKPKNPIIIEGFPGIGLIGTITAEFLIEHLQTEKIGSYFFEDFPASVAVHNHKIIEPVGIHYNKKYNILIVHSISGASGIEFKAADVIMDIIKQTQAKKLICIEGIGNPALKPKHDVKVYFHSTDKKEYKKLEKDGMTPLKEGIIVGVTSAVMLKSPIDTLSLFAETSSNMPDSKAAAKIIEELDKILGLNVDNNPLLEQAQKFEDKLKSIVEKSQQTGEILSKKQLSYVG